MKSSILFVLLACALNAFSQSQTDAYLLKDPSANSMHIKLLNHHPPQASSIPYVLQSQNGKSHSSRETFGLEQRIDSTYAWGWDTLGAHLTLDSKVTDITYNADNYPLSLTYSSWNGSSWDKSLQIVYTYDANNNETSLLFKSWNGSAWTNTFQTLYTYDGNNNQITELSQYWLGFWFNLSNYIYTYDGNHNVLTETDQTWDGAAWLNDYKYTFTYANNNPITSLTQSWDDQNAVWINDSQTVITYDGNHNALTSTYQFWNGLNWDNVSLATYTYDGNNNKITDLEQYWDNTAWVNYSKTTYTYNGNLLTNSLSQDWNGASYDNAGRVTNTYNGQLLTKSINEIWDGSSWKYSVISFYTYGENDFIQGEGNREYDGVDNLITSGDSTHYYFKTVVGTKDITVEDGTLTVYPNPSNGKFTISTQGSLGEIEIFNTIGERVYAAKAISGQTNTEINLSGYAKGTYLVVVKDGSTVTNRTVVLQ